MNSEFSVGLVIGFGFGAFLTAGVFYTLYIQVASELFAAVDKIQKTVVWLGAKVRSIADDD